MTEQLIFGVDGLNPDMVQHMIKQGDMPNLEKLQNQEQTVYGELESFICDGYSTPHTGPMWTSIYTGLKPQEHGLLSGGWNDGDSVFHEMHTVWDKISEETDKQIMLYGMPMTYKAKEIQGEMVSGFVSTTLKSMWEKCLYPDTLEDKLPDDFIEYTSSYVANVKTEKGAQPKAESQSFYQKMSHSEQKRIQTFTDLYNEDSFDIVAYGTTYADKIGHVDGITKDGEYAQKVYQEVDQILGQLMDALKPAEVMVVSDHGFSEYSHDLQGYYLNTEGQEMDTLFDFTPTLLHVNGLEYTKNEFGPIENQDTHITEQEKDDVKQQLENMGYF